MGNPRRANGAARDKLIARVKREEEVCHLCDQWVDVKLTHGLPGSPEVDEIVPVVLGGDPLDRTNCRLSHRHCNRQRSDKPLVAARILLASRRPRYAPDGGLAEVDVRPLTSRVW